MRCNQLLLIAFLLLLHAFAYTQGNFVYTPQHPKAGEVITFYYEPAGVNKTSKVPIGAIAFSYFYNPDTYYLHHAEDIPLRVKGKKLTGTIKTDSSQNMVFIGFSADDTFNSSFQNHGEGFSILLHEDGQVKRGAYKSLAISTLLLKNRYGITIDFKKVLDTLEKEISLHPEDKKYYLAEYIRLLSLTKKEAFPALVQKEIEGFLKEGLKTEEDYSTLETVYTLANLPEQARLIATLKKERFPKGKWFSNEIISRFKGEKDPTKVEAMIMEIIKRIETDDHLKALRLHPGIYTAQIYLNAFIQSEDWEGLKKAYNRTEKNELFKSFETNFYLQDAVTKMQERNTQLDFAEELCKTIIENGKKEVNAPTERQPHATKKEWHKMRVFHLASFKNSYAMVLYGQGRYKEGFQYAKEAMDVNLRNHEGYVDFITTTYALLAEKVLPVKEYKSLLEKLVKEGKYSEQILEVLKRSYVREKGSDEGLEHYVAEVRKSESDKIKEELQKSFIREPAPAFSLYDLSGAKVNLADLKGRVVVLDFWATWCGPCVASFPAMQKLVDQYKDDSGVQFLFIDVAEQGFDRKKIAGDFMAKNRYRFQVLVDEDDRVFKQYVNDGGFLPSKFVIDKNGIIRFKTYGLNGSDLKLIDELKAMIEITKEASGKE